MSPIQPHQEFVIPRNQYVPNSNNTFKPQPNDSLTSRDLCVGSIVFLPGSARGIERVKCILPHSPCKRPELDHMGYEHFVVILDVFRKHGGEIKCYICQITSKAGDEKYKHLDKRILIKGASARPNLSLEKVYLEKGYMGKRSYIRVSHVFEIPSSLLKPTRRSNQDQVYYKRLLKESYYRLMQEFDLKPGVFEDTWFVIQFGATIRTEDSELPRNGVSSGELGTRLLDRESSVFASSNAPSQALIALSSSTSQPIFNFSDLQYFTILSALDTPSTHASISTLPVRGSITEQNSDGNENSTSPCQLEASEMALLESQPVPNNSSNPTKSPPSPLTHPPNYTSSAILPLSISKKPSPSSQPPSPASPTTFSKPSSSSAPNPGENFVSILSFCLHATTPEHLNLDS